ncbi:MAG: PAS domain S-box protein [Lentisphaeria bacterium]|nr:PAS domain S-box protein [Lentisphaeria bacterium]NQZ67832.1 PAS domain S-box protein [Lentisphaeria bacterium]
MSDVKLEDYKNLLNNSNIAIHLVGEDGTILWANNLELETLGYEPDEYIGHCITEFHKDPDVIADILKCLLGHEELNQYPARLISKNGDLRYVLINSNVYFKEDKFIHTRCFTLDVNKKVYDLYMKRSF